MSWRDHPLLLLLDPPGFGRRQFEGRNCVSEIYVGSRLERSL